MAVIHSLFRMATAHEDHPARIMQTINETACQGNDSNIFVTMFIGVLDLPSGRLMYCNAGHDAPFVMTHASLDKAAEPGGQCVMLDCHPNLPVGVFDDFTYVVQEMQIPPDTTIFLYTDGLTEAMNSAHRLFGLERIESVLGSCTDLLPKDMLEKMTEAVHAYVKDAEQSDDLTMMAVRYTPQQ